ncbi:MAG: redoxin domain-containing protein [Chloroflexi bacterium]|nr:MAG: redoxin domain-containing protein [Chloroflexota bacterium]
MVAVVAIAALWIAPRLQPPTGTLVVVAAGRSATSLPASTLLLREGRDSWATAGRISGSVPAAPDQRQLLAVAVPVGTYNAVRVGSAPHPVALTITAGQVEPLLLGIESGGVLGGAVYAGNDEVNLGLGELAGKFVPMPAFQLYDQAARSINLDSLAGKDVVIAAFHTTCHETCPLYTALFMQLAKHVPPTVTLLEVTTDPKTDDAGVLASYARQIGATWTFGTGTPDQVTSFWKPFGVELAAGDTHTSMLALVDRHGYVRLVYRGVPKVGSDISPSLVTSLSGNGLHELGSGGDGWGAADVLQALATIAGPERSFASAGGKAPAFTLTATDGTKVSLGEYAGKPVVINFWASYCPPCKAEMPLLVSTVTQQSGAQLVLVDEGDSREAARSFLDALGVHQPALLDSNLSVGREFGLSALPMTVFVRADGTIDRRQIGQLQSGVLAAELSNLVSQ